MFNKFFPKNRAVYETMWKNMIQRERLQMIIEYDAVNMQECRFTYDI
jgi:hypothetical protein